MTLIPLTEYIKNIELERQEFNDKHFKGAREKFEKKGGVSINDYIASDFKKVLNYTNFLLMETTPNMFFPCNENGVKLQDPELTMKQGDGSVYYSATDEEFDEYDKAESQVFFSQF